MSELDDLRASLTQVLRERDDLQRKLVALRERHDAFERDLQLIGYEVHDGLVQEIVAALLFLDALDPTATFPADEARENFDRARRLLRGAVAEARRLISLLAEPQAEEQGLVASLQTLVERFRADRGLDVELVSSFGEPMLSPAARLTVLRMVSEALNNVGRHSRSKRAEVSVSASDDRLTVAVRDWGVGFDPALVGSGHFGLAGMAQRVGLLGGHTTVDSAPGQGTTVLITLPLHGDTPQG